MRKLRRSKESSGVADWEKSSGEKLGKRMGTKIMQCFSENAGLWPKNTRKPVKNSKQDRDLVTLNFKKITPAAIRSMHWKA